MRIMLQITILNRKKEIYVIYSVFLTDSGSLYKNIREININFTI